ncbi:MAG: PHP domain-containing protein, partial [Planctomycetota bacterium]|nr:PHP domain-containing protein [Planctomycetota bacterium]
MPERRIDLHAHTTHSDGTLAPAALVALAAEVGLHALAITDHDTTSALPEARAAAADLGVEIWTGCEVTCGMPSGIAHVLAYAFDEQDAGLQALLMRVRAGREERNTGIYERLEALGVPVTVAEVEQHADSPIVARPHFARALVAAGHVETVRQAFDRYLRDGGPAYVRPLVPPAPEAVAAVVAAGGVAVLAHPRSLKLGSRTA